MILSQELAQKCVERIIENLGNYIEINIMNNKGIIIASGSKGRIGTYCKFAEEAIKKKKSINIYKEDVEKYEGVKEGINIPFFYKESIIGVIGVIGDLSYLEKTAKIVKMVVELIIERELLKEGEYIYSNKIRLLVNRILKLHREEDSYSIMQFASELGYDLSLPRVAFLLYFKNIDDLDLTNVTNIYNQFTKEMESLTNIDTQDIISNIDTNKILIFKAVNNTEYSYVKKYILDFYMQLKDRIKSKLGKEIYFTVGSLYENVLDIKESYKEAMFMLEYCIKYEINKEIVFIDDYIIEYLCTKIPKKYLEHFLSKYAKKIKGKDELINTIKGLIKNNMNLKKTAKDLYVHRNTIIFRVNKIKELLGVDPMHNDTDRVLLRLLYNYINNN
ncbi:CdaR family transcriptional regulator [Crassaminicella indica]|uniref:Helix-turn-helix domain-containing protein n=1 Tax=Crassaminicella indica TaxID=2855394 RepID=A0ABX8R8M8_9CLOT|nr:sugar diacid recognition domain-containing protein [Crassaminicella indica]QXM05383.1 helix-turn-helix domain-containing protein [Crassaminicella indica]